MSKLADSVIALLDPALWPELSQWATSCKSVIDTFNSLDRESQGEAEYFEVVTRKLSEQDARIESSGGLLAAWNTMATKTGRPSQMLQLLFLLMECDCVRGLNTLLRSPKVSAVALDLFVDIPTIVWPAEALTSALRFGDDHVSRLAWLQMSDEERRRAVDGHVLHLSATMSCSYTFLQIWHYVEANLAAIPHFCAVLNGGNGVPWPDARVVVDGYWYGIAALATAVAYEGVWRIITRNDSRLARELVASLEDPGERSRLHASPLATAGRLREVVFFEKRFVWWARRLDSDTLNKRDEYGLTPLMRAVKRSSTRAVDALLQRGDDVDLLLPAPADVMIQTLRNEGASTFPTDAIGFNHVAMTALSADRFMSKAFAQTDTGKRLVAAVIKQEERRPKCSLLLHQLLRDRPFPVELVHMLCAYAALPIVERAMGEPGAKRQRLA